MLKKDTPVIAEENSLALVENGEKMDHPSVTGHDVAEAHPRDAESNSMRLIGISVLAVVTVGGVWILGRTVVGS